ncbi:hypothetical protein SSS_02508 [Sarcoptes scabiei]|uniref:Uncharacterized protein n=1 Tax=Sarcoptes scabiei TaxID=52283 RepID=A0A834R702_SARSC|nr:hypothetical protein SSS_02508 [Sarcoptes scabiei]
MNNHDGRLQSGLCCDGTKPLQKFGCKNGNKTCKPYWRICIDEIEPDYVPSVTNRINQEAIISKNREQRWISNTLIPNGQLIPLNLSNIFIRNSQRQSIPSIGELRNGSKKISTIQNFFSKIFNVHHSRSSDSDNDDDDDDNDGRVQLFDRNKHIRKMIDKMSPSVCQVGLWSTPILNDSVQFPLKLRRLIRFKSSLSPSSKRMISNRNFILIVEILHRNSRKDSKNFPLISRQINHFNLEANFKNESESFYGGKIYAPISSTAIKLNPTDRRFRFRYRWHLKSLKSSHHRNDNDVDEPNEGQKQFSTIENIGIRPLDTVQMAIKDQIAPNRFAFNTVINTMDIVSVQENVIVDLDGQECSVKIVSLCLVAFTESVIDHSNANVKKDGMVFSVPYLNVAMVVIQKTATAQNRTNVNVN